MVYYYKLCYRNFIAENQRIKYFALINNLILNFTEAIMKKNKNIPENLVAVR